jgi:hypothetical protein
VTWDETILGLWRPDTDALHVLDLAAAVSAAAAWLAHLIVMAQTGNQLAFELAPRMQIDGGVDGLVGDGKFRIIGPHFFELTRYLLRRPLQIEMVTYDLKLGAVRVKFGNAARGHTAGLALQMGEVGIVDAGAAGALELAADRARCTTKAFSNRSGGALVGAHGHDDGALLSG